jgi:16S rRNA (guanine527-N7)-methyltransferase
MTDTPAAPPTPPTPPSSPTTPGAPGSAATRKLLNRFLDLFEKWNKSINLSAASSRDELLEHLEDSKHVVRHLEQITNTTNTTNSTNTTRVLDVGSGGGFPVVVAAICLPDISFVSLEPVHKKHAFLRTAARELGLPNLDPRAQRLDDHDGRDYDAAMSRATFDLAEWLAMGMGYVKPGGLVLGFEGVTRTDLPPSVERHPYTLADKQRAIVIARRPA